MDAARKSESTTDPLIAAAVDDVDVTQFDEMLSLTPFERLRLMSRTMLTIERWRDARSQDR